MAGYMQKHKLCDGPKTNKLNMHDLVIYPERRHSYKHQAGALRHVVMLVPLMFLRSSSNL